MAALSSPRIITPPITIKTPEEYSSVKHPCIFEVYRDRDTVVDIHINGYIKQVSGSVLNINVAHYFETDLSVTPLPISPCGVTLVDQPTRVVNASIVVDGVTSNPAKLLSADRKPLPDRFMTELRDRVIAIGQQDELSVYASKPLRVAWYGGIIDAPAGISVFAFRPSVGAPKTFAIKLTNPAGEVLDTITYELRSDSTQQVAWVNPFGAIDSWGAYVEHKVATKITKDKTYTAEGYTTTSCQAEDITTVVTAPAPKSHIYALCSILTAPSVWLINNGTATDVDVVTDATEIYNINKMSQLQIDLRNKIRRI